jgi:hypothetical protein
MNAIPKLTTAFTGNQTWLDKLASTFTGGLSEFVKTFKEQKLMDNLQYFFDNIIFKIIDVTKKLNQTQ